MPPIALSLSEEVEKFGAYAGLVAFFGFAALVILHFAQARELKRLREWAGRAPERAAELEARVAADAARRAAVPARQSPPAATAAATPGVATPSPPPAGSAPGNGPPASESTGGEESTGPQPAADPQTSPAQPGTEVPAADRPAGGETPAEGAGNGSAAPPPAPPVPRATPAPGAGGPPARRPAPAAGLRQPPPPARRPGPPPPRRPGAPADEEPRSRSRTAIVVGSSLVAVVFAVLAAVQLFGGDGEERPAPNVPAPAESTATPATPEGEAAAPAPSRADTTVAVLNGTTVTGLAAQIADDVERAGFVRGATANYSDQARSASLVFYEEEFRRRAQEVARIVNLPAEDIEPITDDVRSLAGDADIVVVVGADQAP